MRLNLLREAILALFHHVLPLRLSFPLLTSELLLGVMRSGKRGKISLSNRLGCLSPNLGLHYLYKAGLGFVLYAHSFRDRKVFLYLTQLCKGQVTEVTDGSLWGLKSVEDFKVVFRVKYFNHLFFFFFFFFPFISRL